MLNTEREISKAAPTGRERIFGIAVVSERTLFGLFIFKLKTGGFYNGHNHYPLIDRTPLMTHSAVVEVVKAIADAKGVGPAELETPLQEYIDTEAIRLLASHDTASWTLSFELPDHNVAVTSDGLILVDGAREESWA